MIKQTYWYESQLTFMKTSLFLQWMLWQIFSIYHP